MTTQPHDIAEDIIRSVFHHQRAERASGEEVLYRLYHLSKRDENLAEKTAKEIQTAIKANQFEVRVNWRFEAYMQTPQMEWLGRLPTVIIMDYQLSQWAVELAYETELVNIKVLWADYAEPGALECVLSNPSILKSVEMLCISPRGKMTSALIKKINQIENLNLLQIINWQVNFQELSLLPPVEILSLLRCRGLDNNLPLLFESLNQVSELELHDALSLTQQNIIALIKELNTTSIKKVTIPNTFEQVSPLFEECRHNVIIEFL